MSGVNFTTNKKTCHIQLNLSKIADSVVTLFDKDNVFSFCFGGPGLGGLCWNQLQSSAQQLFLSTNIFHKLLLSSVNLSVPPQDLGVISAHMVFGWQLPPISWGYPSANHRGGVCFHSLLAEGRHLDAVRSGYLDPAYLVWLQHGSELWRPGGALLRVQDGKTNLNEVWPVLSSLLMFVACGSWQEKELAFEDRREQKVCPVCLQA